MIELELTSDEVTMVAASLHFRALELTGDRKQVYVKLAYSMRGVGLYQFDPMETACLIMGLCDFADEYDRIYGEGRWGSRAVRLAEYLFEKLFNCSLKDRVPSVVIANAG